MGKRIPITKHTSKVSLLPIFCSSKQGRWRLNKQPHCEHKYLSWDMQDSWNVFILSPKAFPKCCPTFISGQHFLAPLVRKDSEGKLPGNYKQEQASSESPFQTALEVLHIMNFQPQNPGGKNNCLHRVYSEACLQGFPLQKFKIMKWIQDWPLNHTYSSAKEKHVDARELFENKYVHITSAS